MVAKPWRRCSPGCWGGPRKRLAASTSGGTSRLDLGGFLRSDRLHAIRCDRVEEMQATGQAFRAEKPEDVPRGPERRTWRPILCPPVPPGTVTDLDLDHTGSVRT